MTQQDDSINEINPASPDFRTKLASDIAQLAPEAIADGKIDFEKLKELLDGDVSESPERFGLFWPGKRQAIRTAQTPTTATLKPDKENSKNWDDTQNVFIEGDNLEVLKILQTHYYGKIKMIYIDPPYNTGNDFIYKDDFRNGIRHYLELSDQVNEEGIKLSSNSESEGRFHSNWLNLMYPRLKLARTLLRTDGLILLSIDDSEFARLSQICNEIFGETNQIGTFSVTKAEGGGLAKQVVKGHDYLLAYARNISHFEPLLRPKDIRGKIVTKDGEDYWIQDDWLRREFGKYGSLPYEEIKEVKGSEKLREIDEGLANGEYVLLDKGNYHLVGKLRKISEDGSKFYSVIKHLNKNGVKDLERLEGLNKYFDYPKPVSLVKTFLQGATFGKAHKGEIVLDFFAGSSTTAHAAMLLNAEDGGNRKFIMVQLPEPTKEGSAAQAAGFNTIADISRERIRRAGNKIENDFHGYLTDRATPLDTGYRSYKLTNSNFTTWDVNSTVSVEELQEELFSRPGSADDNASIDDLFVELLLKQGFSLTEQVTEIEIAGLTLLAVRSTDSDDSGMAVVAYLDETIAPTPSQLREIIETKPTRFVMLEDAFNGSDEIKTNLVQMCKSNNVELWTA